MTAVAHGDGAGPAVAARAGVGAVLRALGSMRLAVWLLLLLGLLTWLGTLAQTDRSTHDVQREYFESWFVIAELPLSIWGTPLFADANGRGFVLRIPLPGAYPLLLLLGLNLLIGGLLRLQWRWRNGGILVTHFGIAFLLVAGFVKLHWSYAGRMALYEHPGENPLAGRVYESSRFSSFHDFELAVLRDLGDRIEERVVPEQMLWRARGDRSVTVRGDGLPFTVQIRHWIDDAVVRPRAPHAPTNMPTVDGAVLAERPPVRGVQPKSEQQLAGCHATVFGRNGERFEAILWGFPRDPMDGARYPFTFTIDGARYGLDLRHVMYDLPFAIRLERFQKLDHPGTASPRDFRSFVTVLDGKAPLPAEIFMNNPLRKEGYVVFQSQYGPTVGGPPYYSIFEIAYNPSDVWPAIACFVIAAGLLWHFGAKLRRFLKSSAREALSTERRAA